MQHFKKVHFIHTQQQQEQQQQQQQQQEQEKRIEHHVSTTNATDLVDISFVHAIQSHERNLGVELIFHLRIFKDKCIVCYVGQQNDMNHVITSCSTIKGLCFRCFHNGHSSKSCPIPRKIINGTCPYCFLPW